MKMIEVQNLTKDYGNHRGIFDLSFTVDQGEVVGFLGSNDDYKTFDGIYPSPAGYI